LLLIEAVPEVTGDDAQRQVEAILGIGSQTACLAMCSLCGWVIAGVTPAAVTPPQVAGSSFSDVPSRSTCVGAAEAMPVRARETAVQIIEATVPA